jgi:hypothetical protein
MRQLLTRHPNSRGVAAKRVEVEVAQHRADSLVLSYTVSGTISEIRLPVIVESVRADELWQHTCFEVFVGSSFGAVYYEFNFAPSTQWAAYRFDGYRSGMGAASQIGAPKIEVRQRSDSYTLKASLELNQLRDMSRNAAWRLGLSALIEDIRGNKSYWALAHPPGKPDFHHMDCFTHKLLSIGQP